MSTPKISILTPTIRHEGLILVEKALKRQTISPNYFEWVIGSPTEPTNLTLPYVWVKDPKKLKNDYWTIYKSYNQMLRQAKGTLITTFQDYTYTKPDTLERFWNHYLAEPKTIVGAVGNKYTDDTWTVMSWKDPREHNNYGEGAYYQCNYNDIELNLSSFPRQSFFDVGGFDESLDAYSSACGIDVLARLNLVGGWDFKLDQSLKSFSLEHGRLPNWEENNPFNNGVWIEKLKQYQNQPVLNYL